MSGSYIIDGDNKLVGTFNFTKGFISPDFINVGCRSHITSYPFTGSISAIEIYTSWAGEIIPPKLRDIVVRRQMFWKDDDYSSPKKRKKII